MEYPMKAVWTAKRGIFKIETHTFANLDVEVNSQ
jgi:hypothetical protein